MENLSGKNIKDYELQALLGEGAYGVVYRATQAQVKREVAIKIILPAYANQPDFIRRFEAEAQLVAQVEHLHIVPLYDYWREPGGAYLVMRLMKGGSLEESLRENGPWEPADAARLVDQIASALEAAHKQGVVHRDLKPANILLDEDGNAYLSDFGIAKEIGADASATQTGAIVGTPAYITPEQVQSQPVTAQTDIYALGVVLYELLVGGHPFPDTPTGELVVKHLNEPLPYVRESKFDLPAALDGVIQRATAKDPENRYPDALALAADLRRALDMESEGAEIPEEEITNPYKGLRAFQEADADDFFGRDVLIGQLIARLVETPTPALPLEGGGSRFLAVVGPSGSGKSSVVKAGLVPALRKGALPGSDEWFITEMVPGAHPLEELERALMGIAINPDLKLQEQLAKDSFGLLRAAWMALPGKESELLLVIDQFEELFILVEDERERAHFLELLHTAVTDKESIVRVVVTLRADFYDRPLMYPEFSELMQTRTEVVIPLTAAELEQAVRAPAERVGAVLEKGLVGAISADVAEQPGALPLLQYALTELFERREGRMLTGETYLAIGGVLGALGRRAEEVYYGLDSEAKDAARQLFLRLVTLGEGAEDTRRRVSRMELEGLSSGQGGGDKEQGIGISEVIDAFGGARLLSFDRDPVTRASTVEVAHEALLQEWRRLREWLDESRSDIRMQRVLGNAAAEWIDSGQEVSFLMRGSRLDQFEGWVAGTDLALTGDEQVFMDASLEERREREAAEAERQSREAKMERRSRNFLRGLVVVLAVAAVVAVILSTYAFTQRDAAQNSAATAQAEALSRATQQARAEVAEDQAIEERDRAEENEQDALEQRDRAEAAEQEAQLQAAIGLAGQSQNEMRGAMPERAVPLALEALEEYPYTWQAERALGEAVLSHRLEKVLTHDAYIHTLEISQDGTRLLSAGEDGTARVWDTASGEELLLLSEGDPQSASWSPDESAILSVGSLGFSIQLWDAATGELRFMQEVVSELWYTAYNWFPWSPQGDRFVTAHEDGARVWDAANGTVQFFLEGHEDTVTDAAWSPAGDRIVTASWDNSAILWDANSGQAIRTLPGTDWGIKFGTWSPSGDRFILRGYERASVYEAATGAEALTLSLPGSWINSTRYSPDSSRIITSQQEDATARLWDAETGELLSMLSGLTQALGNSWSPSGEYATVVGTDGSVRIWDTVTGVELQRFPFFGSRLALWSPDEDYIYVAGEESNEIRIYQLSAASSSISGMRGVVGGAGWSPDGKQVSRPYPDGTVVILDAKNLEEVMTLDSGTDWPSGANWSPSGDRILTTNMDSTTRVWEAASGELLLDFTNHELDVFSGDWSPDGSLIVTAEPNGNMLILWEAESGEEIWNLSLPGVAVAVWSPDGTRIAVTTWDGHASIHDPATGEVMLNFTENSYAWWEGVAWSSDGEKIVTFSEGNGWIFDTTTGELLVELSSRFTASVWDIYWSPGDALIFAIGGDGTYRVFDAETGLELLVYELGGWPAGALSPDGTHMVIGTNDGKTGLYPTWLTTEDLIAYARECCLLRELTPEEREVFGLPER